MQKKRKIFASE